MRPVALASAVLAVLAIVAIAAWWFLAGRSDPLAAGSVSPSPTNAPQAAPGGCGADDDDASCFPALDLLDVNGGMWTRELLAGRVVLVNYWATWCEPCVREIPLLEHAYHRHKADGLMVIGLLADTVADDHLDAFIAEHGMTYPVVRVDVGVSDAFGVPQGLPTTHVYDRGGRRRESQLGPVAEQQLNSWISSYLNPAGTP